MPKSAEATQAEVLDNLHAAREKILAAAAVLPPQKQEQIFLGIWGIKDLLAHLAGWDHANLEAAQAVLEGHLPAFYTHYDRDWRRFDALLVEQYRREDLADQMDLVRQTHQALLAYLATVSASDFIRDSGIRFHGWRVTIEKLLQAELSDEVNHLEQIMDFAHAAPIP